MEYGNRTSNQLGPDLQAFYDKTWLTQSSQKSMFDRMFTIMKTLDTKSTEEIIFKKWIDPSELYFGANNVNAGITGNDTAGGERSLVTTPADAYKSFILPEGSSGDSKQTMKYVELSATVFPIGDWMPETEEINLLHPVYSTTEAVKQMGDLGGNIIDGYYRDSLLNGAGHVVDITGGGAGADNIEDAAFTNALENLYVKLQLSGAEPVSHILSSSPNIGTVPVDTYYIAMVHPVAASAIKSNASFIPLKDYAAGVTPLDGEIGIIGEYRIVKHTNCPLTYVSAGLYSADVIVFGKDHSAQVALRGKNRTEVVFQPLGSGGIADPLKRKGTLGWKTWLGAKTLYPERLAKIKTLVSFA